MDVRCFDRLTRALATSGSRRVLLLLIAGFPFAGWFASLLERGTDARRRGRRRRARHRHRTGNRKDNRKGKRRRKRKCAKLGQKTKKNKRKKCCKGLTKNGAGICVAPVPGLSCGTGGTCLAFVTSTSHAGNLGGLIGGDAICQQRAQAANLPGTYKAWLSDDFASPSTRFVQSPGPYQRVDGVTIAANWADLTDGQLAAPISVTETGTKLANVALRSWTHTLANGTGGGVLNSSCQNWTSSLNGQNGDEGQVLATSDNWTVFASGTCNNNFRLYCFQQS